MTAQHLCTPPHVLGCVLQCLPMEYQHIYNPSSPHIYTTYRMSEISTYYPDNLLRSKLIQWCIMACGTSASLSHHMCMLPTFVHVFPCVCMAHVCNVRCHHFTFKMFLVQFPTCVLGQKCRYMPGAPMQKKAADNQIIMPYPPGWG